MMMTFHGRSNENVEDFISSVRINFSLRASAYGEGQERDEAQLVALKTHIRGQASEWLSRQPVEVTSTWDHLTSALKIRYNHSARRADRADDAHRAMLDLAQAKGQSLQKYIKRAYKIKDDLGPNFDTILASNFILGMTDQTLRLHAIAFGKLDGQSSFADAVRAVKAMARGGGIKLDRYDESSEESETDDEESDYRGRRQKRSKKKKGKRRGASSGSEESGEGRKRGKSGKGLMMIDQEGLVKMVQQLMNASVGREGESRGSTQQKTAQQFGQEFVIPQPVEAFAASQQPRPSGLRGGQYMGQTYQQPGQPTSGGAGYVQFPQQPAGVAHQTVDGPSFHQGGSQAISAGQPMAPGMNYSTSQFPRNAGYSGRRPCTCFRCGVVGHYSYDCTSPVPLSREDQWRVKQQVEMSRMQGGEVGSRGQFGGGGMGSSGDVRNGGAPQGQVHTVAMVEERRRGVVEEMSVPRASLVEWFEASAVEKRSRGEALGDGTESGEPAVTKVRIGGEGEEGGGQGVKEGKGKEKEGVYAPPGMGKERRNIRGKSGVSQKKPIRMMQAMQTVDIVACLRDTPVSGLNWGTLLELAPSVRRDVAKGLVQERIVTERPKKGLKMKQKGGPREAMTVGSEGKQGVALPDDGKAVNFYTTGRIIGPSAIYNLQKILVDGGSVVNLMPEEVASRMNLQFIRTDDLLIKTADAQLTAIHYYVDVKLEVAGVTADLRVYIIPGHGDPAYAILLSRRWLRQCRAKGNYETDTYIIKDAEGNEYRVSPLPSNGRSRQEGGMVPKVVINPKAASVELDEETVEELSLGESLIAAIVDRVIQETEEDEYDAGSESETSTDRDQGHELAGKGHHY